MDQSTTEKIAALITAIMLGIGGYIRYANRHKREPSDGPIGQRVSLESRVALLETAVSYLRERQGEQQAHGEKIECGLMEANAKLSESNERLARIEGLLQGVVTRTGGGALF